MGHELDAAIERTKDSFTVVIMGNFSSGKTTMINALIGERLLPMSATPTTAVMTELHYGENKKIVLYTIGIFLDLFISVISQRSSWSICQILTFHKSFGLCGC